jgi:hypothetical protein
MTVHPQALQESAFIAKIVKDSRNPPRLRQIAGFIGAASDLERTRIYLDSNLLNWVEVATDDILHVESTKIEGLPPSSVIWMHANTTITESSRETKDDARSYFGGALYQNYLSQIRAVGPTPQFLQDDSRDWRCKQKDEDTRDWRCKQDEGSKEWTCRSGLSDPNCGDRNSFIGDCPAKSTNINCP